MARTSAVKIYYPECGELKFLDGLKIIPFWEISKQYIAAFAKRTYPQYVTIGKERIIL